MGTIDTRLKKCLKVDLINRYYENKCLKLIRYGIDLEKLKNETRMLIEGSSQTLLFAVKDNVNYFCEVGVIKVNSKYIVTATEYRRVGTRFGSITNDECLKGLYVSGNIRYLLTSKDDILLDYLISGMELYKFCSVNTCFLNCNIEGLLLFNNSLDTIYFRDMDIVIRLTDIIRKMKDINEYYFTGKSSFLKNNTEIEEFGISKYIKVNYDIHDMLENIGVDGKVFEKEGFATLTLDRTYPAKIFNDTIVEGIVSNFYCLKRGTQIFIKNINDKVEFCFYSFNDMNSSNLSTTFYLTIGVKVIIYQKNINESTSKEHFIEKEVFLDGPQAFELFKMGLKKYLKDGEYISL